jgi:hypothetical protein
VDFSSKKINNYGFSSFLEGLSMSTMFVNAGLTSFQKIEERNPREIELVTAEKSVAKSA